jgi:hypothetical protein
LAPPFLVIIFLCRNMKLQGIWHFMEGLCDHFSYYGHKKST